MSQQAPWEWRQLIDRVFRAGIPLNPRGRKTLELLNSHTSIAMSRPIVTQSRRSLSYRFMAAEAAWILEGSNRVADQARMAKRLMEFSDDGIFLRGAYGPKVVDQLHYVVEALLDDQRTRQAVMTTWRENPRPSKDIPCTLSFQFLIRDECLHTIVNMRSSDVWLGWPYDVFSFTMISMYVALEFNRHIRMSVNGAEGDLIKAMGTLWLNAGSQHIYETDIALAEAVRPDIPPDSPELSLIHFSHPEDLLGWLGHIRDASVTPSLLNFMPNETNVPQV